jgi:hypothetical protein
MKRDREKNKNKNLKFKKLKKKIKNIYIERKIDKITQRHRNKSLVLVPEFNRD